uniref:EF-hand domain-containing protein n=1 Tax=Romanomermis culicivorax TaxID=13658 RepID=A0A915JNL5_ROMCU
MERNGMQSTQRFQTKEKFSFHSVWLGVTVGHFLENWSHPFRSKSVTGGMRLYAQNGALLAPNGTTLREAFEMLDKDRTGRLTVEALSNFMNSLNVKTSKENLDSLMRSLDSDNRGYLDYSQFVTLVDNTRKFTIDYKRRMEMAFNTFDKNGDGYISLEELNCTMKSLGEILSSAELDQMMQFADLNKDGKINAEGAEMAGRRNSGAKLP